MIPDLIVAVTVASFAGSLAAVIIADAVTPKAPGRHRANTGGDRG